MTQYRVTKMRPLQTSTAISALIQPKGWKTMVENGV